MFSVESRSKMENHLSIEDLFKGSTVVSSTETLPSLDDSIINYEDSAKMKLYKEGLYSPGSGEICAKYVAVSHSSVLRHVYYEYPGLKDPGIMRALQYPEEEKVYDEDGQELYLDLCKTMNLVPIRSFYHDLKKETVNLRYYGVNPVGVRAICMALAYNRTVKCLDLTSNFLEHRDACYHLGQLLGDRNALTKLVMAGCRIGHECLRKVVLYLYTRTMNLIDLSGNNIQDIGFQYIIEQINMGAVIKRLNLSNNDLTSDTLVLFAEAIEFHDHIKYLDLSWNKFVKPKGSAIFCRIIGDSQVLVELNLSWTSLSVVTELGNLLSIETLKVLDLSHNKLTSPSARVIARALYMAKSLKVLDLSCNPFSPSDALYLLVRMKQEKINLKELFMDHIAVSKEFAIELKQIMKLEFRRNAVITHGDILRNYTLPEQDIKIITMKRLLLNMKKKRKNKLDILLYLLEQQKNRKYLDAGEFNRILKLYDAPIKADFVEELTKLFPGPRTDTGNRSLNLNVIVDYIHRLWPEKKLPPTPPPTPLQEPLPPIATKKKKGKKGKK